MEQQDFYRQVRSYLVNEGARDGRRVEADQIGEDDNLFDLGVVNSFSMMRLLAHIEELVGTKVDVTRFEPQTFFTLAGMYDALHTGVEQHQ